MEDKPDLEVLDGGMNINRDIKKFLDNAVIWSEQLEALSKHSEQQAKLVTDMVGTLEREMEELRTKVSKLEKEIAKKINTVTKEEMEHKFAGIAKEVGRVATLEKAVSKLEEDRANIKPDSYYLDLIEKQTAKKSVAQNNEIASISSKVTALGKVVTQHTTTLEHDLVVKVNKLQKEVAKKINSECNDTPATDTNSIKKKITDIEENLQAMDKLGKQFKHLDDRVIQLKNTSDSNTYMLHSINEGVYYSLLDEGEPHPSYTEFKQRLVGFNSNLYKCRQVISKANPNHWDKAVKFLNQNNIKSDYQRARYHRV